MKRTLRGTITRHRGFWCLRYRERIREGDSIKTVQRSRRLAPADALHKTRRSVEPLAETLLEPINKVPAAYVAIRLGDFADAAYFPHLQTKRRPSTLRGYRQMWNRYLKPRCANLVMHDAETRTVQALLDTISAEDKLAPQTMAHIKHLVSGMFRFAIAQGHLPRGTINPVTFAETEAIPDFDGRAYSLEEIALMLSVLPEPSQTVVALAAFTGLRAGEVRGLTWEAYTPGDENSLGVIRVLRSVWRGRIGEPKNSRSKAAVPLIPQLEALLDRHREASGNPASGPIFANGEGKALDLDSLYRRQMKEPLKAAGIEWEGWHGFRRGLATNLERIGVRESIAAMVLRHSNDRVTRKHYIKPPTLEAIAAMRRLSETLLALDKPKMLPKCSPEPQKEVEGTVEARWLQ
ncbi:MAG: tyrosine-type recombinase/integrase [Terriglobales bacterium]